MNRRSVILLGLMVVVMVMGAMATPSPAQIPPEDQLVLPKLAPLPFPPPRPDFPPLPPPRQPPWLEFLKNNELLHVPLFAGVLTLAVMIIIGIPVVLCRIVLGLLRVFFPCRDDDSRDGGGS